MAVDIKITTELLYIGALLFASMDAAYVPLLAWRVNRDLFRRLKLWLVVAAALTWYGIWRWAIGNYWEPIYSYLFPRWAQTWVPWIAIFVAGALAAGMWVLAVRSPWNHVLTYCLLAGLLGSLTHAWAVTRGLVTRPPMLQGASPLAAVVIAFFEYMFYWCTILALAILIEELQKRMKSLPSR